MAGRAHWIVAAVTLLLAGSVVAAQQAPKIEPRAEKILRIMSDLLAGAKQFTVHNDQASDELAVSNDLVELSSSVDLAVRRPGEAHAVLHGDLRPMRYWIGGGRVAVMDVSRWTYASHADTCNSHTRDPGRVRKWNPRSAGCGSAHRE